jgi:steroid delta-isomerase
VLICAPHAPVRARQERPMVHGRGVFIVLVVAALLNATPVHADDGASRAEIAAALTQWTADFNGGRADKVCDLFSRELRADFRGQGERGYDAQCALLKKSLGDKQRSFAYAFALKEILVWGDAAVVRLTWTLTVRDQRSKRAVTSVEPGLDVFRRERDGRWRIVRYMAYEQ